MRRPEVKETQTLARLTFNPAAARQLFDDTTKGVRLRIERGVVSFRPSATTRGADVVLLERRHRRGVYVDIVAGAEAKKLMTRLFRAGLSEEQPHFLLEPQARGWYGIDHVEQPDPRQLQIVVSDFEVPPPPVDLLTWRRFLRIVTSEKPVDADLWNLIRRMIRGAAQVTAKPQRGRASQARLDAESLVTAVEKNVYKLRAWTDRQSEYDSEVTALLTDLGIVDEVAEEEPPPRRRRSAPAPESEPEPEPEPEPLPEAAEEVVVPVKAKRRRKQPAVYEEESPPPGPTPTPGEMFERGIDRLLDETDGTDAEQAAAGTEEDHTETEGASEQQPDPVAVVEVEEFVITETVPDDELGPDAVSPEDVEIVEDWGSEAGADSVAGPGEEATEQPDTGEDTVTSAQAETAQDSSSEGITDNGEETDEAHQHEHDEDTEHRHPGQGDQPDLEEKE